MLYFISFGGFGQEYDFSKRLSGVEKENFNVLAIIDSLQKRGYLEAKYVVSRTDSVQTFHFTIGKRFRWKNLKVRKDAETAQIEVINAQVNQPADRILLEKIMNNYLSIEAHNQGYPFAEAHLTIDSITDLELFATIDINYNNQITYDSLIIKSKGNVIHRDYLQRFLKIPVDTPFSTEMYLSIPKKLKQLDFLRLIAPPTLTFSNNQSQITLEIEKIATSQLDAFIGLIPEQDRTNFTGQIDVSFQNLFKRAINWQLNWQKYSANSQFLNTNLSQTAAFKTPLSIDLHFGLLQEDSTFLQNNFQLNIIFPFKSEIWLGLGYKGFINNIIREFDSAEVSSRSEPFRSSQLNAISVLAGWKKEITYPILENHQFINGNIDIGLKKIRDFNNLPEIWKDVPQSSISYGGQLVSGAQQKILKRFLIEERLELSFIENDALSRNDLLRLGGLQNLRGFDRNFFYTNYYGLLSINYRYFLDNSSSFFLLTDFAALDAALGQVYTFGAGLDVKTKNGWFRLIYAVGSRVNESINFSTAKVHFGYIALF